MEQSGNVMRGLFFEAQFIVQYDLFIFPWQSNVSLLSSTIHSSYHYQTYSFLLQLIFLVIMPLDADLTLLLFNLREHALFDIT